MIKKLHPCGMQDQTQKWNSATMRDTKSYTSHARCVQLPPRVCCNANTELHGCLTSQGNPRASPGQPQSNPRAQITSRVWFHQHAGSIVVATLKGNRAWKLSCTSRVWARPLQLRGRWWVCATTSRRASSGSKATPVSWMKARLRARMIPSTAAHLHPAGQPITTPADAQGVLTLRCFTGPGLSPPY